MPGPPVLPPVVAPPLGSYLNPSGTGTFKLLDVCKMAMVKIGAVDPIDAIDPQEAQDVQAQANILIDSWNAAGAYVWANTFFTGLSDAEPSAALYRADWDGRVQSSCGNLAAPNTDSRR